MNFHKNKFSGMKNVFFTLILLGSFLSAQQKELSISDAVMGYYNGLYPLGVENLNWVQNSNRYYYTDDDKLIIVDADKENPNKEITLAEFQKRFPKLNRIPSMKNFDEENFTIQSGEFLSVINLNNGQSQTINLSQNYENIDFSPKSKAVAFTVDNGLYIKKFDNQTLVVKENKDKNIISGQAIHRSEYGIHKGTFWSPEGNYLAFYEKDETQVTDYPLVDIDTTPARLKNIKYPMAGQGSEKAKVGIYDLKNKKLIYLDINTEDEHYLTNLGWSPDEKHILLAEINRATTRFDFNLYDAKSGKKIRTIFSEENERWVEPEHTSFFIPSRKNEFLFISQRDGFNNIYHYNINGKLIQQLTKVKWVIKDILGFNGNEVIFEGTGEDGRENHIYKVNLKSKKITNLTPEAGTHQAVLNDNGTYLIDSYSSYDVAGITQIVNVKTGARKLINQAENPLKEYKLGEIDPVEILAADGKTKLYANLIKPANFDENKKYPVLVYVYGGPHAQLVTNSFLGGTDMWFSAFATQEDYLVFTLDNRGSAYRGFEFESVIHRQLGENEIQDQMKGVEYLKSLKYVDSSRMAVYGWSFGGFMASSLMLKKPGVFTTGVAGGPVTDWSLYEVMYGERYMDTPQENPEGYQNSNLANHITNLKGKLMLITGSIDNVVVPQHSLRMMQEAVTKNIPIDFFEYPMHEHNVYGYDRIHLIEKIASYITTNNQ